MRWILRLVSFNSLRTGKHIQSPKMETRTLRSSEQVSIPYERESISKDVLPPELRLPICEFQFPTNGKAYPKFPSMANFNDDDRFQFPTNGKAYPKVVFLLTVARLSLVSIPYERESISKGIADDPLGVVRKVSIPYERESISKGKGQLCHRSDERKFQFPTNGKAYPKLSSFGSALPIIPLCFNSLRTGKHIQSSNTIIAANPKCFNSLRTGKHIQSK